MLLLNLLGILAIGSFSLEVAVAIDDLEDTLNQALFLVKLLKSDFAQNLRSKDEVMANSTEDENSTCSLPLEEFNSTVAMNQTEVTVSQVTPSTPATPPPSTPATPPPSTPATPPPTTPAPLNVMPPGAPMMMPYANWPPMAMGYPPPSGAGPQNFPDENFRFPYRLNRRRMMPDYYYFDSPAKSHGNFRRFGNDVTDGLGNTPATSQAQTTSSLSSATSEATTLHLEETTASTTSYSTSEATTLHVGVTTASTTRTLLSTSEATTLHVEETSASTTSLSTSEATTLHVEETTPSTTSLSTTLAQPTTSIQPTTEQAILRTTISANLTILTTAHSAKQSIPADPSKQTILPTILKSILLTAQSKKQSSLPTTEVSNIPTVVLSTRRTKRRKRVGHKKRVAVSKATTIVIPTRNKNHFKVSRPHLRHRTHNTTTAKKWTKDDLEMSQVANELEKELEGTNAKDIDASYKDSNHHKLKKGMKATTRTTTTTTMKVFLQGSSRIPIPFPENNGFCYFHPESALCGAI